MEKKSSDMGIIGAVRILLGHKKVIIRNCLAAGVVFGLLMLCVPRYYKCEITLAPEYNDGSSLGSFSSIASSLGINLGSSMGSDAISPSLYPDLVSSKEFLVSLFGVKVTTQDGKTSTDYYTYLTKHQDSPWWSTAIRKATRAVKNIFKPQKEEKFKAKDVSPFRLTEKQYMATEIINSKISCEVDQVSTIITLNVTDQDPLVCASIADSVREHLQLFITRYRTSKARNDMEYYSKLLKDSRREYDKAIAAYTAYADSHKDVIMQAYISQRDELENDMRMKFNVYTALQQQLESAKAKVQERTPAFTVLKCASVPIKPAGPKRVLMTLLVVMLVFGATAFHILKGKELLKKILGKEDKGAEEIPSAETSQGAEESQGTEASQGAEESQE
jgi:capsule polysaccharide export protein KpsE/RkpR